MNSFDERARDWDSDPAKVERARVVAQAINAALPSNRQMTALEYGCGTGLLSFALADSFTSITLADTSQGMLDVLATKIEQANIHHFHPLHLDLGNQPLPSTRFDVIYSLMTMHHILDISRFLANFYYLLKPGGFLCVADLEKEDGSFHGPSVTDVHKGFDRLEFQADLEKTGFADIQFSSVFEVKKIIAGQEKAFPVFLAVARKPGILSQS